MQASDVRARRLREYKTYDLTEPQSGPPSRTSRLQEVAQRLIQAVKTGKLVIPMLPAAASEVLAIANNPSVTVREVEQVVKNDPLLAARVLAVANSAAYGGKKVGSLANALSRLGTGAVRDVLYQAVTESHIFRGDAQGSLAHELQHGVAVGRTSALVCKALGIPAGQAFVCGLLHDLGRPIILDLLVQMRESLSPSEAELIAARGHGVVGAQVATRWQLPTLVVEACRFHHHYRDENSGRYSQLANIVAVADRIAEHHSTGRDHKPIDFTKDRCFFDLGLDPATAMEVVAAAAQLDGP